MLTTPAEALQESDFPSPLPSLICEAEYAQRRQEETEEAHNTPKASAAKQLLVMGGGIVLTMMFASAVATAYQKVTGMKGGVSCTTGKPCTAVS